VDVVTALDRLPKVELHCHVEGTMRPDTVVDLARKNGIRLPSSDPTELYRYSNLDTFLEVFWLVQSTLGSREDWARLAYESIVDGAAHGLVYRETFFTPARHLEAGQDLAGIVAGLAEGLEAAEAETGVRAALIADIDRAYGAAAGLAMVRRLVELRDAASPGAERVIGVGLDSTPLSWPASPGCGGPRTRARRRRRATSGPGWRCSGPSASTTGCRASRTRS
jgi:adenosine deaminase